MHTQSISRRYNSTNVRFLTPRQRLLRWGLAAGWRTAPEHTAKWAQTAFFAPACHPISPEAEGWIEKGRPFRIRINGKNVQGWQWGRGPGVLFVHGWNGRAAHFAPFFGPLLDAGFSVTAFDAPGHGDSEGRTSSYFQFTDAVRALMRTGAGPRLRGIVGHSVGGAAVVGALSREETAAKIVLIAPALDLQGILFSAFEDFGIPSPVYRGVIAGFERRYGYSLERDNPVRLLPALEKEMLIIHDRSDPTTPYIDSRRMADAQGGVQLHTTDGLGHKRILVDAAVVRRVVDYLTAEKVASGNEAAAVERTGVAG